MKRVKTIIGNDGFTKVTVAITVEDSGRLMRHEVNSMTEALASSIMGVIPSVRHLDVQLSELVVK